MSREKLQQIADTVGIELLETPTTLTFKDGTTWDDVWAMWREMGDMFFLRGNGTIWQFTEAYPATVKGDDRSFTVDSGVVSVQEFLMDYVERNYE